MNISFLNFVCNNKSFSFCCNIIILVYLFVSHNNMDMTHMVNDQIILSQRGGEILMRNGYRYTKRRVNNNKHVVWRCSKRKICNANLVMTANNIVVKEETHKCKPNEIENEVKSKVHQCIQRAKNETTPIPSIYAEVVEEFNDAGYNLIKNMPPYENLKQVLYRRRHKELQTKKTQFFKPKDVVVPGKFTRFLLADYYDNCRIIVFASAEARKALQKANHVFLDGTFRSAPPPFLQLYTLHMDMGSTEDANAIMPVIYALLPNKKQKTYEILLELIKSQIPNFQPNIFTLDYEASAMLAIEKVFPNAIIQGCLFHFIRCLWRKYEQVGMKKSAAFKSHVKRCIALAQLPKEYIMDGWLYTKGECIPHNKMTDFNNYFERTWIKSSSLFHNKWCFHNIAHRTNNAVESWNSRFNKKVIKQPNIATLISKLINDSKYYFGLYKQKGFISKKNQETLWTQQNINRAVREFIDHEISLGHFIEKISNL